MTKFELSAALALAKSYSNKAKAFGACGDSAAACAYLERILGIHETIWHAFIPRSGSERGRKLGACREIMDIHASAKRDKAVRA